MRGEIRLFICSFFGSFPRHDSIRDPGKWFSRRKYNPRRDRGAGAAAMRDDPSERSLIMAYKKPQMVAKSNAKKSYVAGCPAQTTWFCGVNTSCELDRRQ